MQQPSQSQSTPAPVSGSQAWGTQPQQTQPSLPDLLSASMSSFPAAFYQQQQFQALQQHLHNNQLSQFQVPASDPRAQAVLQQQQRLVSQPQQQQQQQQQQQSVPALGSLVHALGGHLPPHSVPGASSVQPHASQSAAPTGSLSEAQHSHESQHPQPSLPHLAGQSTLSHPSQVARPVPHTLAKQPAHGSHGTAAPEAGTTGSPRQIAHPQPTVAAANVGQAAPQQNAAPHAAGTVHSASRPHAVARPATQAAGHPSMPHAHFTSQSATQAVPQPSIFRPPTHVSRPATDAAEQSSGFRSQAMSRPAIEAAGQVADPQPQAVRRPATEAAERPLLFRPQAVHRPATEAAAQHTVYRPQAAYRPATDAASLPAAARPKAVHRPATEAAQQSEPLRSVSLSRVASEAAEQALETRPSGVPAAGRLVWAKLARYPWWPAEVSASSCMVCRFRHQLKAHTLDYYPTVWCMVSHAGLHLSLRSQVCKDEGMGPGWVNGLCALLGSLLHANICPDSTKFGPSLHARPKHTCCARAPLKHQRLL